MLDFYGRERVRFCDLKEDGDMLLFQYGVTRFDGVESFDLDTTRQTMGDLASSTLAALRMEVQPTMRRLSLRFGFELSPELLELGHRDEWCSQPGDLGDFRSMVEADQALRLLGSRADGRVQLVGELV